MKIRAVSLVIVFITALVPSMAHAYIDPGTGIVIWQGLIAIIGAILVFLRNPLALLKRFFSTFRRK